MDHVCVSNTPLDILSLFPYQNPIRCLTEFVFGCLHSAYTAKTGDPMKLTKKIIDTLPMPATGQKLVWDDDVTGLGVRLTPSKKTYIVQGRVRGKKTERRISLGEHGTITLDEARRRAKMELAAMLNGTDPMEERKILQARAATLRDVVDKYLEDRRDLKASSRADIEKHLQKSFASWADRPFVEITRDKVLDRFRELSDRSPSQANQAFRVLRALMNYARAKYRPGDSLIMPENPVRVLSDAKVWNRIQARSGRIPTGKVGVAWNVIQDFRQAPDLSRIGETLADAVAFLMLTGCRWSEMAGLTWDRVNLDEATWYIPDPKNRTPVTFPLPAVVVEILEKRQRTSEFVFPGRSEGHIREARSAMDRISALVGVHVSPHDLRRTFRAIAGECGVEFWKTKLLMGHKMSGDVTIAHYTEKSDLRYLAPEINAIADWIVRQGVIAGSDNVVNFRAKEGGGK